jgi:hypothetical protein
LGAPVTGAAAPAGLGAFGVAPCPVFAGFCGGFGFSGGVVLII